MPVAVRGHSCAVSEASWESRPLTMPTAPDYSSGVSWVKIALIGTRGVPARYGGFETAVEEVGRRLVERGHHVTVFCRAVGATHPPDEYLGMQLVHLPAVQKQTAETLSHTALSVVHRSARTADAAIVFNAANAPLVPVLKAFRVPTAVHVDGLEWRRSKWSGNGQRYYRACERLAVRWADALIADAVGIQDYYRETYGADSVFIPYGAPILTEPALARLAEIGLERDAFHLVVARFEPENHVHLALAGYATSRAKLPLVVVGSAPYGERYQRELGILAEQHGNIRMLGPVWDQQFLDALYAGGRTYLHGHSVGGTNPSLLRAMGAGATVLAYDVTFNREVLGPDGRYWQSWQSLSAELEDAEADPERTRLLGKQAQDRAAQLYTWDGVADGYERLCEDLADGRSVMLRSR